MTTARWITLLLVSGLSTTALAQQKKDKGLLPEVRLNGASEELNEKKALSSEIMITRSENRAISSLQNILKKKKGAPEEADLWYRLAELYMRRSKSGRFFDLHAGTPLLKQSSFPVPNEKGLEAVGRAAKIYTKIESEFPKFAQMDSVLFNNAFAHQQLGRLNVSEHLYRKLISTFPKSPLIPDGTLALGELLYDQGQFRPALEAFLGVEKFPESRVYSYGMYKSAWSYYNLQQTEEGIQKLVKVVKLNPPLREGEVPTNRHNLRRESLRDLTIFVGDTYPAKKLYSFFEDITSGEELGESMENLAKLYESHSRQKEMNLFLNEYMEANPSGPFVASAHLMLTQANEDLKNRELVLTHLRTAGELCRADSNWRKKQSAETLEKSCTTQFRSVSMELATKWWEVWLKNKQHKEFSSLAERLFEIILQNEEPGKQDLKTRYAYAELLFQMEKYDQASAQYALVRDQSQDPTVKHDASYSALFAKEKSIEQKKDPAKESERKALALKYLEMNPKGKWVSLVQFKMGHIAYEEGDYAGAETWLKPIARSGEADLKRKSEDLLLDILNIRKDYAGIREFSKQILAGKPDAARQTSVSKILEEAHFTEIQEFAKAGDKKQASARLQEFAQEHKSSNLSQEALWQALSLLYAEEDIYGAADLSQEFVKKYPDDKRNTDALKEAAKAYVDVGQSVKAAQTLEKVATRDPKTSKANFELAADLYALDKNWNLARPVWEKAIKNASAKEQARLYQKLLDSYADNKSNKSYKDLQNTIMAQGVEPFATQMMIEKAQALLEAGKDKDAFDLSLKANARSVPSEVRAAARLVQAKVLEKELAQQSVKARLEKFATVLAMKTEKLDKAHTAYFSTLKMSQDPAQQLEAFRGIDRVYENYISSLEGMPLPTGLSEAEQSELRGEISKIVKPISDKRSENAGKLQALAASRGEAVQTKRELASLPPQNSYAPTVQYPEAQQMKVFLLKSADLDIGKTARLENPKAQSCKKATWKESTQKIESFLDFAGNCFAAKQYPSVENAGLEMAKKKDFRAIGLYYASLAAEAQGLSDKSLWYLELALKNKAETAPFLYQKARLLYSQKGMSVSLPIFEKVLDMQLPAKELQAIAGSKSFSEGDYSSSVRYFSGLTKEELSNLNSGILFSEAYAQKGEIEKALAVLKDLLNLRAQNADLYLQQAHLFEVYKSSPTMALDSYEKALKVSQDGDLKSWLAKKIEYLKTQNKVGQHVTSGDF